MGIDRLERLNALLRRELGEDMFHVLAGEDVDPGAVTVTQVSIARNLRNATVRVSVFGPAPKRQAYIRKLAAKAYEFQRLINRNLSIKYTPQLHFKLDNSLEKGDHVLDVLSRLEKESQTPGQTQAQMPGQEQGQTQTPAPAQTPTPAGSPGDPGTGGASPA